MRLKYRIIVNLKKCDLEWAKAMTRKVRDSLNEEYVQSIRLWEYKLPKKQVKNLLNKKDELSNKSIN